MFQVVATLATVLSGASLVAVTCDMVSVNPRLAWVLGIVMLTSASTFVLVTVPS